MKRDINWTVASMLAAILALASMPVYAQSVLVSAESGNLVPIDGTWEFPGCFEPDADEEQYFDYREFLVFDGDTIASKLVSYESVEGICTGAGTEVIAEGPFPITAVEHVMSDGWAEFFEDEDSGEVEIFEVDPPLRQDFSDFMDGQPLVTALEIDLGIEGTETLIFFIDDTDDYWFLYRSKEQDNGDDGDDGEEGVNAVEDEDPPIYMDRNEPLRRQIVLGPRPGCDIELTQDVYVDGDSITTELFRVSNPTGERVAVEVKAWMERPDESVKKVFNLGAFGFFRLWPESDVDLGPLWLGKVHENKPRGAYEVGCRVLDPKTGTLLGEDRDSFEIQ